jgi:hypothetical protein
VFSAAVWAALASGWFFQIGRAHVNAELLVFGLDPNLFPRDHLETILDGVGVGFVALLLVAIAIAVTTMGVVVVNSIRQIFSAKLTALFSRINQNFRNASLVEKDKIQRYAEYMMSAAICMMIVIMAFAALQHFSQQDGKERAENQRFAMDSCNVTKLKGPSFRAVHIERIVGAATLDYNGFIVTCEANGCGIYDPLSHQAQFVPTDKVSRFQTTDSAALCNKIGNNSKSERQNTSIPEHAPTQAE